MTQATKRIHPLVATAAVAVILVSLVGVAAMTGMLPSSNSTNAPINQVVPGDTPLSANDEATTKPGASNADAQPQQLGKANDTVDSRAKPHPTSTKVQSESNSKASSNSGRTKEVAICDNCGTVESVRTIEQQAEKGSGLGAAAGAILGGVLGHQVGGGNGKKLATVAGAVGGGLAGNEIEKRTNTSTRYEVRVRMENGHTRTFTPSAQPDWRAGDRVRVIDGNLTAR